MNPIIKGVLFDKDGTLFKYGRTWQVWCERVIQYIAPDDQDLQIALADTCGFDFANRSFKPGALVVNASAREVNQVWADLHPSLDYQQIERIGIEQLKNLPVEPVCDLNAMLDQLKAHGMIIGCATNDFEASAKTQLTQTGIYELFDFVCGFDSGHGAKPEPGMLQAFAKAAGLQTSEIAMVGDSTHDLHCGRAAGAGLCVGVLTGPAKARDIERHADVVLNSIKVLPTYLKRFV